MQSAVDGEINILKSKHLEATLNAVRTSLLVFHEEVASVSVVTDACAAHKHKLMGVTVIVCQK